MFAVGARPPVACIAPAARRAAGAWRQPPASAPSARSSWRRRHRLSRAAQEQGPGAVGLPAQPSPDSTASTSSEPTLRDVFDGLNKVEAGLAGLRKDTNKRFDRIAETQGALAEAALLSLPVAHGHPQYRGPPVMITSARDIVPLISTEQHLASYDELVSAVCKSSAGYGQLCRCVLERLKKEFLGELPEPPVLGQQPVWAAHLIYWRELERRLQAQRGGKKGRVWWLPFLKMLKSYCTAAAASPADLAGFLCKPERGGLVLALLMASAGGALQEVLEMNAQPRVEVQASGGLLLDLLEVKSSGAEARKAVEQLTLAAHVLVFALHAANKSLLEDCGPLSIVGTISAAVQGQKLTKFEGMRVDVSCAALAATEGATMVLRTKYLKL